MGKHRGGGDLTTLTSGLIVVWYIIVVVVAIAGLMYWYHHTTYGPWFKVVLVTIGVLVVFVLVLEKYSPRMASILAD
jgi:hypothetical protein